MAAMRSKAASSRAGAAGALLSDCTSSSTGAWCLTFLAALGLEDTTGFEMADRRAAEVADVAEVEAEAAAAEGAGANCCRLVDGST